MRLKSTLTALALSLSALATPAAPALAKEQDRPEPARVYKDWVVGCRWSCEAVVVWPEGDAEGYTLTMSMMVWEYVDDDISLTLHDPIGETLQKANGPYRLLVDGKAIATFHWKTNVEEWVGILKRDNSIKIAKGKIGEIVDKDGMRVSLVSLLGATAAMRDMDERLGMVGYTHALVAKGRKRSKSRIPTDVFAAPFPPNMPEEVLSTPPSLAEVMDSAIKLSGCADDRDDADARFDAIHPLKRYEDDPDQALILVGCGHGAYNYMVMPLRAKKAKSGRWVLERVMAQDYDYEGEFPMPMLTNVTWDEEEGELIHYNKGRGLGDCGESVIYEISPYGSAYVSEIREMPVCRGATYWPAIW